MLWQLACHRYHYVTVLLLRSVFRSLPGVDTCVACCSVGSSFAVYFWHPLDSCRAVARKVPVYLPKYVLMQVILGRDLAG